MIPFSVAYGVALSTECGVLSSGRSLVFKYTNLLLCFIKLANLCVFFYRYGRTREIQTEDLDTTRTLYIQFTFASGSRSCGGGLRADNTILLQFSLDQGITWNTLQLVGNSLQSSTGIDDYHIVIPPAAKYPQTRFRIWQPNAVTDNYNIWSIDNFLIGGVNMSAPAIAENFDPIDRNKYVTNYHSHMYKHIIHLIHAVV